MNLISLTDLANLVAKTAPPTDRKFSKFSKFALNDLNEITFDELPIDGALAMYQVKAATAPNINITGTSGLLSAARGNNAKRRDEARQAIELQLLQLNAGLANNDLEARGFVARTYNEHGREYVGGVVSAQYAPLTHDEFVGRMLETPGFNNALVHRWTVTPAELDFTLLLDGAKWEVDGGLKSGVHAGNGQFGAKAAELVAMLFRLLCTNGMMNVFDKSGFKKSHTGALNLAKELDRILEGAASMFEYARLSMETQCDVARLLTELYRRGFITRGALAKTLQRMAETMGGRQVDGGTSTLWGATQALTAAGRDYGFTQMTSLGQLAGQVMRKGEKLLTERPRLAECDDYMTVLDANGVKLAMVSM